MLIPNVVLATSALVGASPAPVADTIALVSHGGIYLEVHVDGHVRRLDAAGEAQGELELQGAVGLQWIRSLGAGLVAGTAANELLYWTTPSARAARVAAPGCGDVWCPELRVRTIGTERLWVGSREAGSLFGVVDGQLTLLARLAERPSLDDVDLERERLLCTGKAEGAAIVGFGGNVREVVLADEGYKVSSACFGRSADELFLDAECGDGNVHLAHLLRLERIDGKWRQSASVAIDFFGFPTSLRDVVVHDDRVVAGLGFTSAVRTFDAGDLAQRWSHDNDGGTWFGTQLRVLAERGEVFVAGMGQTYVLDLDDGEVVKRFPFRRFEAIANDGLAGQLVMRSREAFTVLSIADNWPEVFQIAR